MGCSASVPQSSVVEPVAVSEIRDLSVTVARCEEAPVREANSSFRSTLEVEDIGVGMKESFLECSYTAVGDVAQLPPSVSEFGSYYETATSDDDEEDDLDAYGTPCRLPPAVSEQGSMSRLKDDYLEFEYTPITRLPPSVSEYSSIYESSMLTAGSLSFASEVYSACATPEQSPEPVKMKDSYLECQY
eukprot:TRINITY_DN8181_c0_g5_i1.p1 TRINITY_DN8181_c0_g5~~TRINITY_DN8181_c0_g5_i1.p1  ORF type:complete len:211 (+),score=39.51 TRINITY_DN8181_c0_g5_i1:70-633(+)